jgi:DNA repair photolyase
MKYITRKSLLYKTAVEYGDYTINHVEGCSHGCIYPCYAMMMAKRFGKVKDYEDWIKPKIVKNAEQLLLKELPKQKDKVKYVHMCFSTDPFMYGYEEISELSCRLMKIINDNGIKCTALTKGILPNKLSEFSEKNEFGITLVSLNEDFRKKWEPGSANYKDRIKGLYRLHKKGMFTWVSIEPYPTPNIINQDFKEIIDVIGFVDKIIFGRLNYNSLVTAYKGKTEFFNDLSEYVINYCVMNKKKWHIKEGTMVKEIVKI